MSKKIYTGKTLAFKSFQNAIWKTEKLLDLGVVGIDQRLSGVFQDVLEKFEHVKGVPGPKPKSYTPLVEKKGTEGGSIELNFDARTASFIKKLLENDRRRHDDLRFFLYSNIFLITIYAKPSFRSFSGMGGVLRQT